VKTATSPPGDVDAYIAAFPASVQRILRQIRSRIRRIVPDAEEAIKYRMPTFVLGENLVHFAAYEHHIGFYPTPSAITAFRNELAGYESAKGSVQFPLDRPIPLGLIERIVRFRVGEVRAKSRARKNTR
jgi:uncharacterized protein YdhG (YjbR/CyaY superfamily)